ncbi:hypothetical protein BG011_002010 [Mortierella polycephala]|uniref:Uncharacterized protein n=1 Tax=Mortierella polycephala TaxID=41804 RepID=A0A9P6QH51_9FUNG|nr:hypothetical protein BG011_002010 [Mortierella polycephala]
MSTTMVHKYQTLKAKKSTKRLSSEEIFHPQHTRSASTPSPTSPTTDKTGVPPPPQPVPYAQFITDLITAFNSLSAPTSSSTLHTSFQGVDHEAHVDFRQKKKVVKALQHADPAKVNEIIALLKAMPDPTAALAGTPQIPQQKTEKRNKAAEKEEAKTLKQQKLDLDLQEWDKVEKKWSWETQKSNDQLTGAIDPDSCKGPTSPSWWFPSILAPASSSPPSDTPTTAKDISTKSNVETPSTGFGSLWLTSKPKPPPEPKRSFSSGEQIAQAAASLLAIAAVAKPKAHDANVTTKSKTATGADATLHRQSSISTIKGANLKRILSTTKVASTDALDTKNSSYLVTTINSLTRQLMALQGPPPTHAISAYTFWWGYEIYIPHKCIARLEQVSNTSLIFFNFLSGAISTIPGLAALVPIAKIISAWVGYQWSVIKTEDQGKGVVISATW